MRDRIPLPTGRAAARAALAAGAGVAGSYAVTGFTPAFLPAPVTAFMAKNLPGALITFAILTLGSLGQKLNLLSAVAAVVGLLGLVALAGIEAGRRVDVPFAAAGVTAVLAAVLALAITGAPASALATAVAAGAVVAAGDLGALLGGGEGSISPGRRRVLGSVAGAFGVGIVGVVLDRRRRTREPPGALSDDEPEPGSAGIDELGDDPASTDGQADAEPTAGSTSTHSREYTASAAPGTPEASGGSPTPLPTGTLTGTGAGTTTRSGAEDDTGTPPPTETPTPTSEIDRLLNEADRKSLGIEGLDPLVSETFYEVDINAVNPSVDTDDWSLSVTGAVENAATYSYDDLVGMPAENRFVTLRCVGEDLNGKKMDTALWTGVPVDRLLEAAAPTSDCECVMLRAADGYYEEFPLEALRGGLLAYGMNGEVLPRRHGYPFRALVPGHWGEINVKWLTEIEFLEEEATGYWEKRGWHGTGPVNTVAKLHATNHFDDGRIRVAGHAYAGTRGVERVEVSTDGGDTWTDARLSDPLPGDDVWRQWTHAYDPPSEIHGVVVRAVDGTGAVQPEEESNPFPSGPTGWVSKTIDPRG